MHRGRPLALRRTGALVSACAAAQLQFASLPPVGAQATTAATQNDAGYTAKIKQYTTAPYFLTELVDHLPASATVPTPEKILGYIVGAPGHLTYSQDLYRYFRALEKATPRVRVFTAPERSEEGKEQLLVVVSDEANLAALDRYKQISARLADPRGLGDTEAQALIAEGKPFYWLSGSIHSPETGSPEMLMEMAYRLAVEETPFIQTIRKNTIVLITPTLEVDGHDRMVDLVNYHNANPGKPLPPLVYWGHYVAHDNNRDGLGMALALSRNQMQTFLEYHPQVLHDLHESVPFLYTSTGSGPYNAWLDPIVIDEWHLLAYHEIEEMTKRGVPGVWTHSYYDGWAPNYMFYVANGHNAIGRFYETFGSDVPDTLDRTVGPDSRRTWDRPSPPFAKVKWSFRNNINLQESGLLFAMHFVAENHERFLNNFYLKSLRAVRKARNEGPAAYVVSGDTPRPVEAADMVNLLRRMGVEVQTASREFTVKEGKFPAGSYVIRMDQPYSRMADMLLDTQYYSINDPRPYDDTGWTLGALRNVKTVRVTDTSVLQVPMTLLTSEARIPGKIVGAASPAAFVIDHNTDNTLATLRFRLKEVNVSVAESQFSIGRQALHAGSWIVKAEGSPAGLRRRLETAVADLGLTAIAVERLPNVKTHPLAVPRIALLHTWADTQDEGWFRIELDRLHIPYTYISDHVVRDTPDLRRRFDVILFPPVSGFRASLINGLPKFGAPIPWKKSALTPNIGLSPDQTDDLRGGMELRGVANLQKFVEDGGLFLTFTTTTHLPIDYGLTPEVSIEPSRQLQARGSVYNATFVDRKSPISYGYEESLPIYFSQAPLFQVAKQPDFNDFGGGEAGSRTSGRGSPSDTDTIQGMPQPPAAPAAPPAKSGEERITEEQRLFFGAYLTPKAYRPRVVLRFASDEKQLLVSGMLAGGSELANRPAVIDVPVGRGHVVLFANNPMWRHETQGSFFLLFNAILNYDHLDAGQDTSPAKP